jgi:hypothetical protein
LPPFCIDTTTFLPNFLLIISINFQFKRTNIRFTHLNFFASHSQSKKKQLVKMQFFSIIAFSMIATLAIAAPVADPAPAADAAAKQDLVDFWQDA